MKNKCGVPVLLFFFPLLLFTCDYSLTQHASGIPCNPDDHATLDLFVMSRCPYALLAEKEISPFVRENSGRLDLKMHSIAGIDGVHGNDRKAAYTPSAGKVCGGGGDKGYLGFLSLHGRKEVEEDMRQLVIKELYPDAFLDYILLRAEAIEDDWRVSAHRLDIDILLVDELVHDGTGQLLLDRNLQFALEKGVTASPTLYVNGATCPGAITDAALKEVALGNDPVDAVSDPPAGGGKAHHFASSAQGIGSVTASRIGTANPAAVYCREMGYAYRILDEDGQRGACMMPDGTRCDAWDFLQGECGQRYSFCAENGYDIRTLDDGLDPFSREYAACYSKAGRFIGSVSELTGLSQKVTKADSRSSNNDREPIRSGAGDEPPSFDWRNHNGYDWMTPVKNQGGCGSCCSRWVMPASSSLAWM